MDLSVEKQPFYKLDNILVLRNNLLPNFLFAGLYMVVAKKLHGQKFGKLQRSVSLFMNVLFGLVCMLLELQYCWGCFIYRPPSAAHCMECG